jgi:hypothetical protein
MIPLGFAVSPLENKGGVPQFSPLIRRDAGRQGGSFMKIKYRFNL